MFNKQALVISTAAGAGTKSTMKDVLDSMLFWGVGKTYKYGVNVAASDWKDVTNKKKLQIENKVEKLANRIKKESKIVKPRLKVKALFYAMRFAHKKFRYSEEDFMHWEKKGWIGKVRPWNTLTLRKNINE